jgi:hypothetical protein
MVAMSLCVLTLISKTSESLQIKIALKIVLALIAYNLYYMQIKLYLFSRKMAVHSKNWRSCKM